MKINKKNLKFKFILISITAISTAALFYFSQTSKYIIKETVTSTKNLPEATGQPSEIKGDIVTLKRLKREYFRDYHNMSKSDIVRRPLYFPLNPSFQWTQNYLEKELKKEENGKVFLYVIFDNKDNKLIGSLEVRVKNQKDPGQFGCWLNENYWGGGRIKEAIKLISNAYFKYTNADGFTAHVEMWNLRSYYALKKSGFQLVDFYYDDGKATRYILEMKNPNKSTEN